MEVFNVARKKKTRDWFDIQNEYMEMCNMSCRPSKKKLKEGTVIDMDKSVRWNIEQVEKHNKEVEDEVKTLNTKKNKWRDTLREEILEKIVVEADLIDNTKQADLLYQYVMSNFGDFSIQYSFEKMEELVDLFNDVQKLK